MVLKDRAAGERSRSRRLPGSAISSSNLVYRQALAEARALQLTRTIHTSLLTIGKGLAFLL